MCRIFSQSSVYTRRASPTENSWRLNSLRRGSSVDRANSHNNVGDTSMFEHVIVTRSRVAAMLLTATFVAAPAISQGADNEKFDYTLTVTARDGEQDVQHGSVDLSKQLRRRAGRQRGCRFQRADRHVAVAAAEQHPARAASVVAAHREEEVEAEEQDQRSSRLHSKGHPGPERGPSRIRRSARFDRGTRPH
jgi:hypothetical protein